MVERKVPGLPVQVPGPRRLRLHHLVEALRRHLADGTVLQHCGRVEHPAQRRHRAGDLLDEAFDLRVLRDVGGHRQHPRSRLLEAPHRLLRLPGVGATPAHEHEMAGTLGHHPRGHL